MKKAIYICLFIFPLCYSCTKMGEDLDFDWEGNYQLWRERAEGITEGYQTDYEKAKAIYEWECKHIAYDKSLSIYTAEECWEKRRGVCQAYSELFVKLAYGSDIKAEVIQGDARTLNYLNGDGGHAWVKVNTEKGWILVDPTWGAGYTSDNGAFVFYDNNMSWFDADPELMVFTHFPDNATDQMLTTPITRFQYKGLPLIVPGVSQAGWEGHDVLMYFLDHLGEPAPLFYLGFTYYASKFRLSEMPYCGNMKIGQTYVLKILSLDEGLVVSSNPNLDWEQEAVEEGVLYKTVFQPESEEEFHIYYNHSGILKYDVVW